MTDSGIWQTPTHIASNATAMALCIATLSFLALAACSGEGSNGDDGAKTSADAAGGSAAKAHAGPCNATFVGSDGVSHPNFLTWTYDAQGRPTEERRSDDEISTGVPVWLQNTSYDDAGHVLHDVFATDAAEPSHDWTFTYGADGRPTTRKGTQTGYGDEDCIFEWSTVPEAPRDVSLICDFSYPDRNKDGERIGTITGKYGEHHAFQTLGDGKEREVILFDNAAGGTPDKEIARYFDAKGRLDRVETDASLQGFASHVVRYLYDADGHVVARHTDSDGDGTVDAIEALTLDAKGNVMRIDYDDGGDGNIDRHWLMSYDCWD